jgi:hypothetical protein
MSSHMYAFSKSIRNADHVRRFTIAPTAAGWEVKETQDSTVVRKQYYQDWHRVERVRRAFTVQLSELRQDGWVDVS